MIPELGLFCLILSLMMAITFSVLAPIGLLSAKWSFLKNLSRPAVFGQCFFMVLSFATLMYCFVQDDFSVAYIAQNSHTTLPLVYKMCALWGAHEGSLLLWALILACWTVAVGFYVKKLPTQVGVLVPGILGAINTGILLLILCTSNPFARFLPVAPQEGLDLNPLLQDPGFVLHPPFLYMGYVGLSVPFAFALAAMLMKDKSLQWTNWARPWALLAWGLLTAGITLGSWWAYYELGWGGWWFWDPVENASFMPWLLGAALVHALYICTKKNLFISWGLLLAITAFTLSLIGTFLVRSGVISSVHAFASDPARGLFILCFLAIVVVVAYGLYLYRGLYANSTENNMITAQVAIILLGNVLFFVATLTVLLGTLYPIMMEVIAHERLSVGPPYFNSVFIPMMIPILALMGLAPHLKYQQAFTHKLSLFSIRKIIFLCAMLVGNWLLLPQKFSAAAFLGFLMGEWVILATLWFLIKMFYSQSWSWQRLGMIFAHLGMGITVLGVSLTTSLESEQDLKLSPKEAVVIQGFEFVFKEIKDIVGSNYEGIQATFHIKKNGKIKEKLYPEKRFFIPRNVPMSETAISPGLTRDFYIALGEPYIDGSWSVRIYIKPFIRLIWIGGLIIAVGAGIASILAFDNVRRKCE